MNILTSVTLTWWQVSLFKLCLLSFGIYVGARWPTVFEEWMTVLLVLFVVIALYLVGTVWWKAWTKTESTIHFE